MLIAPLSLVHLIIGMDTTSGNLLNWNKPKLVVIAVGLTRREPVDLPLRLLIYVNTSYKKVQHIISDLLKLVCDSHHLAF